jgi:hypothetical protein
MDKGSMQYPNKGKKMSANTVKNASPLAELNDSLSAEYMDVIAKGEDANIANLEFIKSLDDQMQRGLTQAVATATLKATAKGIKVGIIVKHGHIPSIPTARIIVDKYFNEMPETTASAVLTLASRVLADVKASGVRKHIAKFDTLKELADGTRTKAESQAEAKADSQDEAMKESAKAITLESIVDAVDSYLSATDLKTLTTSELEKLHKVIAKLITVENNTKALTK